MKNKEEDETLRRERKMKILEQFSWPVKKKGKREEKQKKYRNRERKRRWNITKRKKDENIREVKLHVRRK